MQKRYPKMMHAKLLLILGLVLETGGAWLISWGVIMGTKVRFSHGGAEIKKGIELLVGTERQHARKEIASKIKRVQCLGIIGAIALTLGFICQLFGVLNR